MDTRSMSSRWSDDLENEIEKVVSKPSPPPYISYKSIHCPISDCQRITTGKGLGTHFKHEHQRIPKHYVTYDKTTEIQLNLERLVPGKTHCSALLLLSGKNEDPQRMQIDDFVIIPVMTSRLKCVQVDTGTEDSNVPKCLFTYDLPSIPRDDMQNSQAPKQPYANDTVVIWLATPLPGDKKCCITGLNKEKSAKYYYCGGIHPIQDTNNIEDILPKGSHLMLLDTNLDKHPEKGLYLFRVTIMKKRCKPCP